MEGLPDHLEKEIKALEMGKQGINRKDEDKVKKPKIQKVPPYLEGRGFENYFKPEIIAFGPFHWCNYQPYKSKGEQYKDMWTAMYLVDTNQQHSCGALLDRINHIKDKVFESVSQIFVGKSEYLHDWEKGRWLLIRDGCSILQVLDKSIHDDPEQELNVSTDHLVRVHRDMLLLKNQVPLKLLKLICNDDNAKLNRCMLNFLKIHGVMKKGKHDLVLENDYLSIIVDEEEEDDPIHLLDYLRSALLIKTRIDSIANHPQRHQHSLIHLLDYLRRALLMRTSDPIVNHPQLQQQQHANNKPIERSLHLRKYRIGSVLELKDKGIRVQKHSHDNVFYPIFNSNSGTLQLPQLTVDGSTLLIFLNLIAYEMCPDFRNDFEITSYVVFLSSLIETPEDAKELRSCLVLINELASDKEVSDLFHQMDTLLVPETSKYAHIRDQIHEYSESHPSKIKMLGWMREAYSSFLSSPWKIIALLAATLGLILTFIQTWLAIHPKC